MKNLNEQRVDFIKQLVPLVCAEGWLERVMYDVSEELWNDRIYYKTLFSDIEEIVQYFECSEDERMLKKIGNKKEGESTTAYIGSMLKYRIKEISGGKEMLIRLKEFYLALKHISDGPKAVWNTSDVIWRAAGDKSTDMNYYSKRFLLSSVYTMSIRHYVDDRTDIDGYIDNSLNKVVSCAKYLKLPKLEDIPILRMFS